MTIWRVLVPAFVSALCLGNAFAGDLRDAQGHKVDAGIVPRRIVSLSPNLTEMLFTLGLGPDRIVGVTRFCDYPPEAAAIPQVGGIVDPSVEGILSLRPDLVLVTRGNPQGVIDRLREADVPVFALEAQDDCGQVVETMRELLLLVHPPDTAAAWVRIREIEAGFERARSRGIPPGGARTVFFYDPMSPDWTAGPGTFLSEAIQLAGGRNLFDDASLAWPRVSLDTVVGRQPDWVCIASQATDDAVGGLDPEVWRARLMKRPGWRGLTAIREGRICVIPADLIMRPGPRIVLAIERLAACLDQGQRSSGTGG